MKLYNTFNENILHWLHLNSYKQKENIDIKYIWIDNLGDIIKIPQCFYKFRYDIIRGNFNGLKIYTFDKLKQQSISNVYSSYLDSLITESIHYTNEYGMTFRNTI